MNEQEVKAEFSQLLEETRALRRKVFQAYRNTSELPKKLRPETRFQLAAQYALDDLENALINAKVCI